MPSSKAGNDAAAEKATEQVADHEKDQSEYNMPDQYWFSSTLSPLLAGTFGPMASAFSICALVKNWRIYVPTGLSEHEGVDIQDPPWLLALNALSLAAALIGNLSLLLNMAKRLRFSIAQPITISGFYLASVLLITDMAAITSSADFRIGLPEAEPYDNHRLTSAFYYAIFAAALYFIIASLMCLTVYGANQGYYEKSFDLTTSQRTLMLQTMMFFIYLLLGALVWSKIEGWQFIDAVYWAEVTLLTIGLGDYYPVTPVGQGLLFPFAVGGIVILGLVVGSIRTLVLERSEEKITARIVEKRRHTAVNHVNVDNNTIRIGWFAKVSFPVDPKILPAQRREQEFHVMRAVLLMSKRQRRYMALIGSALVAFLLWFVGAIIFKRAEAAQQLDYLSWLFFAYTSLLTIGYGTPYPDSNAGKAFFVFWSLLAVPSLTILISNMGDTVIKTISELTDFVGAITVLPREHGTRATIKMMLKHLKPELIPVNFTGPGTFGDFPPRPPDSGSEDKMADLHSHMLDRLADRVSKHTSPAELQSESAKSPFADGKQPPMNDLDCDIAFYHYVLSREVRDVMKYHSQSPPKKYSWVEWEYYIRLMGNLAVDEEDVEDFPGQKIPNVLAPQHLAAPPTHIDQAIAAGRRPSIDGGKHSTHSGSGRHNSDTANGQKGNAVDDGDHSAPSPTSGKQHHAAVTKIASHKLGKHHTHDLESDTPELHGHNDNDLDKIYNTHTWSMPWSWLSNDNPLMSTGSESEWILERLAAALERELNRTRLGYKRKPPISYTKIRQHILQKQANDVNKRSSKSEVEQESRDHDDGDDDDDDDSSDGCQPSEQLAHKMDSSFERAALSED